MPTVSETFAELDRADIRRRVQSGDTDAFRLLYETAHPILLRFAYHMVQSRDVADDVVQNVFVMIWINRVTWSPGDSLQRYLYRAVRNRALDVIRHSHSVAAAAARVDAQAPYGMSVPAAAADIALEMSDTVQLLAGAIERLPERQRVAVLLRWYDELSIADVAEVMGVSRQAVEKLLKTAEARLRVILRQYGGAP